MSNSSSSRRVIEVALTVKSLRIYGDFSDAFVQQNLLFTPLQLEFCRGITHGRTMAQVPIGLRSRNNEQSLEVSYNSTFTFQCTLIPNRAKTLQFSLHAPNNRMKHETTFSIDIADKVKTSTRVEPNVHSCTAKSFSSLEFSGRKFEALLSTALHINLLPVADESKRDRCIPEQTQPCLSRSSSIQPPAAKSKSTGIRIVRTVPKSQLALLSALQSQDERSTVSQPEQSSSEAKESSCMASQQECAAAVPVLQLNESREMLASSGDQKKIQQLRLALQVSQKWIDLFGRN